MNKIEHVILKALIFDEKYSRRVLPFIDESYFKNIEEKTLFTQIREFIDKYNKNPSVGALRIISQGTTLSEDYQKRLDGLLDSIQESKDEPVDHNWIVDSTEEFCKKSALYNAIMQSISIMDDDSEGNLTKGAIPQILSDALAVSFDSHIGHDYLDDVEDRYDFYHQKQTRYKTNIDVLNKITNGGFIAKTLNVFIAGVNVGKTLIMCSLASDFLLQGYNVLYITAEVAQEEIAKRIDANLLDVPLNDIMDVPKETYTKRINKIKNKTNGKLVIKEYPTSTATANHIKALLNELKLKKKFIPDIIFVDYINIMASSRMKNGLSLGTYLYVKAIAEELRALAVEFKVPLFSATQLTRSGFADSDPGLEDTAESFGLPATADFMVALITNEELQKTNQLLMKQLKNRLGDKTRFTRSMLGVDTGRQRIYNCEQSAQDELIAPVEEKSIMDKSNFGERMDQEKERRKKRFEGIKV